MAHFAKIDENNVVLTTVVVNNEVTTDENGVEVEQKGIDFLHKTFKENKSVWVQYSYNTHQGEHLLGGTPFRGNPASIEGTWDPVNEFFLPPRPFPSWALHNSIPKWTSPRGDAPALTEAQKNDNYIYLWNEPEGQWDLIQLSTEA